MKKDATGAGDMAQSAKHLSLKHEDLISCLPLKSWTWPCTSVTPELRRQRKEEPWSSLTGWPFQKIGELLACLKALPLNIRWRGWRHGEWVKSTYCLCSLVFMLGDSKQSATWALRDRMPPSELHRHMHSNVLTHVCVCTHTCTSVWPL